LNEFKIHTRLTISGIGVQIRMENGYARIDRIFPGGPAERSGQLHVGDMIVGVAQGDGPFVNTVHAGSDKIMEMVLGKDGSVVRLQLVPGNRKDPSKRRVITLIRREVRLTAEEAQAELIEMHLAGCVEKLGWITVPSFYGEPDHSTRGVSATRDVATLLTRLKRERIKGLVIDLRNNAGGSVDEALKMAGMFINQGPIVQLKDSSGEIHVLKEQLAKACYDGPMVVLENKLTASASEVFSAAMQDYRRAPIVGDSSSFGKGAGSGGNGPADAGRPLRLARTGSALGARPAPAAASLRAFRPMTWWSPCLEPHPSDLPAPCPAENEPLAAIFCRRVHRICTQKRTPLR
jgi:carboxyl-terminal processing protease